LQITSIEALKSDLARHGPRPVYALFGPERYLVRQALVLLKESVVQEGLMSLNYAEFNLPDDPVPEFLAAANTFPMMAPHRMVVVRNVEKIPEGDREALIAYLNAPAARSVVALVGARSTDALSCTAHCGIRRAPSNSPAEGRGAEVLGGGLCSARRTHDQPACLDKVVELAGSSLESVVQEIDKLLLFAARRRKIPAGGRRLGAGQPQHRIFELTDAMGARNKPLALKILANLLDADESPIGVAP